MTGADAGEWRTLDKRTVVVAALTTAGVAVVAGIPTAIGLAGSTSAGAALLWVLPGAVLLIACGSVAEYVRWRRTRYRVGPQRVELRSGLVLRKRRSLQRDRIRNVDLTANPLIRVFGLVNVKIGTGEQAGAGQSSVQLNPISLAEGERLRHLLLGQAPERAHTIPQHGSLAELDPRWIRFAPVSFVTPALGAAAFGAVLQVAEWFRLRDGVIGWAIELLGGLGLPGAIAMLLVTGLLVGAVGSLGLFVEMWWQYRLEREVGGTLRVRRGLLTTRSISLQEKRLRGVDVVEPLGNRLLGAARVDAVATGMVRQKESERTDHKTLLPAAPRHTVDRVAADVLREPVSPTEAVRLRSHPRAARARRLRWALGIVAVVAGTPAVLGALLSTVLLHIAWIAAAISLPIAVLLALDAYRNLGHGIAGGYLLTRSGSVRRSTVALQRRGVIGWTLKQSIFQRRAGLLTLSATTAAGAGAYSAYDVAQGPGLEFAAEAVPELLGPFLERA